MSASTVVADGAAIPGAGARWRLLAALIGVYTAFGVVATSIAPMLELVRADLGMSRTAMGLALGAWAFVFIGTAPLAGRLIDRVGLPLALTLGGVSIALSAVARSLATGPGTLWLAVAVFGIGGPLVSAGAPTLVRTWFPEGRRRRLAVSAYAVAPSLGSVLALAATNSVLLPLLGSWRRVVVVEGLAALVATGVWLLVALRAGSPPAAPPGAGDAAEGDHETDESGGGPGSEGDQGSTAAPPTPARASVAGLLGSPPIRWSLLLAFGVFFLNHGINTWLPTILVDLAALSPARSSSLVAGATVAGMVAALIGPSLVPARRRGLGLGLVCAVVGLGLPLLLVGVGPAVAATVLVGIRGALVPLGALLLMEAPGVTARNTGLANGLWFSAGEVGGVTGPLAVGIVADTAFGFQGAVVVLAVMALLVAAVAPRADGGHRSGPG